MGPPAFTMSFVALMKVTGEKSTTLRRSAFAVVEPHSRSTLPEATASRREAEVTGSKRMARSLPSAFDMSSTISRQRSMA